MEQNRSDFLAAMGETFSEYVCPPVSFEDANPHECCEAIWSVLGLTVTPDDLAALDETGVLDLCAAFGTYFESEAPSANKIRAARAQAQPGVLQNAKRPRNSATACYQPGAVD